MQITLKVESDSDFVVDLIQRLHYRRVRVDLLDGTAFVGNVDASMAHANMLLLGVLKQVAGPETPRLPSETSGDKLTITADSIREITAL